MAGMDDLDFEEIIDDAIGYDDEADTERFVGADTEQFESPDLLSAAARKGHKTPVLSGRKMAAESSAQIPLVDEDTSQVPTESAGANMSDSKKKKRSGKHVKLGSASFEAVYKRAGLPSDDGFTVFKVEEILEDPELADLEDRAQKVAVRAILKSHGVDIDDVFEDAVARREALDSHDARLKSNISRVEDDIDAENSRLQNEIEEFAAPRIAKMEANNDRLERLRRDYRDWFERKKQEQARVVSILEPWGGSERLRVTNKVDAVREEQDTAPLAAVSKDDVFEETPAHLEATQEDVLGDEESYSLGEQSDARGDRPPSVKTELPSEFEESSASMDDVTGAMYQQPRLRGPRTPLQGFVAAMSIILWAVSGTLIAVQMVEFMEAIPALAVVFGGPILVAFFVSVATRHSGQWWTGFWAVLFYLGVAFFVAAHAQPANLVRASTTRPVQVVDEARLNEDVERGVHRAVSTYAEAIAGPLGVEDAIVGEDDADDTPSETEPK